MPPKLVLFTEVAQTGCGRAGASVGPFYCPLDRKVYIDPSFYRELQEKFAAPVTSRAPMFLLTRWATTFRICSAHRIRRAAQERGSESDANALQYASELWRSTVTRESGQITRDQSRHILNPGDVEEAPSVRRCGGRR